MILKQKLKLLCDIGERFGGAAKLLELVEEIVALIIDNRVDKHSIYEVWEKEGIKPLKFKIYHGQ